MNLKVLEEKARKDNPDYPRGCAVVFDIVAMGLSEHGGYHEELAREELPPNTLVLSKSEFVQKYISYNESPFAKEEAHELWQKLGG